MIDPQTTRALMTRLWREHVSRHLGRLALVLVLSAAMETLQQCMPGRVASNLDIVVNSLGALTGGLLALHHARWMRTWTWSNCSGLKRAALSSSTAMRFVPATSTLAGSGLTTGV